MVFSLFSSIRCCVFAALTFFSINAMSSVVISGTRVIYPSDNNEVSVNVLVENGSPVVRTVSGDVDSATITLSVPQLTKTSTSTGDITGTSVSLSVQIQNNGGGYYTVPGDTLWSSDGFEGVSGQTITIDNCYGIGITFEVGVPVVHSTYNDGG